MKYERTIYIKGANGCDFGTDVTLRLTSIVPIPDEKIADAIGRAMNVVDVRTPEAMADVVERNLMQTYDVYATIIYPAPCAFEMEVQHGVVVATAKPLTC